MRMNIANKLDSGKRENEKLAEYEFKVDEHAVFSQFPNLKRSDSSIQGDELRNLISAKIEELEEGELSDDSDDDPIYEPGSTQSDDSYTSKTVRTFSISSFTSTSTSLLQVKNSSFLVSDEDGFEPNEHDLSGDDVSVQEMLDLHGEDLEVNSPP